jgi:hypothetical protein
MINDRLGWAVTSEGNVMHYVETIDNVGDLPDIPKHFSLSHNYPNPFTTETAIQYETPSFGRITLTVYDLLGREVATLVDEVKDPGQYAVKWNATSFSAAVSAKGGLASGIYFYRLTAGKIALMKKMIFTATSVLHDRSPPR